MALLGNSPKSAFMLVNQLSIMMLNLLTYTQSEPNRAVSELILQIMIVLKTVLTIIICIIHKPHAGQPGNEAKSV